MKAGNKVEGDLRAFSIFDITQSLMSGRKTAHVTVENGPDTGYLYFAGGQIVHALDGRMNAGEKAVFNIFTWRRGSFVIDFDRRIEEKNITAPTDYLLLEVARNLDEVGQEKPDQDDAATQTEITAGVEERLDLTLRRKLSSIFTAVAGKAEPARDRYTRHAFDQILVTLFELKGSAVFVRHGRQPRIKTADGFVTLKDAVVERNEVDGFIMALLSEAETLALRERKEVTAVYNAPDVGAFSVAIIDEDGSPTVIMTPARTDLPKLDSFGMGNAQASLAQLTEGLILVAGPLGSGKSSLVAALAEHHATMRDKCVALHSDERLHTFENTRGFVMRRPITAGAADLGASIRSSLQQGADVVAVDPFAGSDGLRILLEVSATGRLVIGSISSLSMGGTLALIQALTQDDKSDRVLRLLADHLQAVVALGPRRAQEHATADVLLIGRDEQAAIRKRDFNTLRINQVITSL